MEEHISLFVALADVFDAANHALNEATHLSMAVPIAAALKVREVDGVYEERSDLLRLQAVFCGLASSNAEFQELTKDGRAALDQTIQFIEKVFGLHFALARTPENLLRKVPPCSPPPLPSLRPLRELLFNLEESLSSECGDDFRFAAARLRTAIQPKPPMALSAYITSLPRDKMQQQQQQQQADSLDLSFSFDGMDLTTTRQTRNEVDDALNLDELDQMSNDSGIAKIAPKPVQKDDDEMMMLDQLEFASAAKPVEQAGTAETLKSKESMMALLSSWKNEKNPRQEVVKMNKQEVDACVLFIY